MRHALLAYSPVFLGDGCRDIKSREVSGTMTQGTVFISYRRNDTSGFTRAIYDRLAKRFTQERVFMDIDAIEPGLRFDQVIDQAVGRCEVLLVMIGKDWLGAGPSGESPRIDDPKDPVRIEVASALKRDIRVIPVLVDGATMPSEKNLPNELHPLLRRNAIEIGNTRFEGDVSRLTDVVASIIGPLNSPQARRRRTAIYGAVLFACLVGVGAVAFSYFGFGRQSCVWDLSGDWTLTQTMSPAVHLTLRQEGDGLAGLADADGDKVAIVDGKSTPASFTLTCPGAMGPSAPTRVVSTERAESTAALTTSGILR
ncbi:MAG: toll/interleukin-1 receptor domain-containing protein [Bauldia sp.]